jgi:hypothetical protein
MNKMRLLSCTPVPVWGGSRPKFGFLWHVPLSSCCPVRESAAREWVHAKPLSFAWISVVVLRLRVTRRGRACGSYLNPNRTRRKGVFSDKDFMQMEGLAKRGCVSTSMLSEDLHDG